MTDTAILITAAANSILPLPLFSQYVVKVGHNKYTNHDESYHFVLLSFCCFAECPDRLTRGKLAGSGTAKGTAKASTETVRSAR